MYKMTRFGYELDKIISNKCLVNSYRMVENIISGIEMERCRPMQRARKKEQQY